MVSSFKMAVSAAIALLLCSSYVNSLAIKFSIGCDTEVLMDYAMVSSNTLSATQEVRAVNSQCYKCSHSLLVNSTSGCSMLWTPHEWTLYLVDTASDTQLASGVYSFGDQGKYTIVVEDANNDGKFSLQISETKAPVDSLEPFWIAMGLFIAIFIAAFGGPILYEKLKDKYFPDDTRDSIRSATTPLLAPEATANDFVLNKTGELKSRVVNDEPTTRTSLQSRPSINSGGGDDKQQAADEEAGRRSMTSMSSKHSVADIPVAAPVAPTAAATAKVKPPRLNSLDTFRGFSLCIMIFVNYGGGGYWFFDHAPWHGLTFADLLFPWFMWMMGVSMALSFSALGLVVAEPVLGPSTASTVANRPLEYHAAPWSAWAKVLQRSATLFAIGMFLANGYDYKTWRIPGVLQYFAVSYLVTSATVLYYLPTTNVRTFLRRLVSSFLVGILFILLCMQEKIRGIKTWERMNGLNSGSGKWALHPEDRSVSCIDHASYSSWHLNF